MSTITAPLYFQFPPGQAEIYKQQSQIIGICPSGFTVRHVDVSSLQENAYEFVSNTEKNLKITILVHVEGIAGLRRITMKSSVSIQNKLPFPLEVIHPNVPRSDFISFIDNNRLSKTVCLLGRFGQPIWHLIYIFNAIEPSDSILAKHKKFSNEAENCSIDRVRFVKKEKPVVQSLVK